MLFRSPNLRLVQAEIVSVQVDETNTVTGVKTHLGELWQTGCVIVAAGTYLDSRIFIGDVNYESGPDGFLPSRGLSASLSALGIPMRRFKTGTPARINRRSVDLDRLELQPGEDAPLPYSADTPESYMDGVTQLPCHVVYTNEETHRVIRENIRRSAMYGGHIHGTGPRYCPSIEDKIVRFADKERHQLFLEPIGADTDELYLQGFSTSLPTDVQAKMLATLPGFENAEMMRYAYAIEYDCCDPTALTATLEFRTVHGLFGAGQFNGTSGYEEAAAQGLIAGINAACRIKGTEPLILPRASSYIGTLIDDLIVKGTNEPYRMMTSRSEYRLLLRQDNADERLTPIGHRIGLVSAERFAAFKASRARIKEEITRLKSTYLSPAAINPLLNELSEPTVATGISIADLLRRPLIDLEVLSPLDQNRPSLSRRELLSVQVQIKYEGYINRQISEVMRQERLESRKLPDTLDYTAIKGLRIEAAQKLTALRPATIGQASRISGVSPADISVLLIYLGLR